MTQSISRNSEGPKMKILVLVTAIGAAGLTSAQPKAPVATVASSSPITIQGVTAPVTGSADWPVIEGDVIRTSSSPAEVRMKDGTRIYVPPSSRFVVTSALPSSKGGATGAHADLRVRAATGAPETISIKTQKVMAGNVLTVLEGGAIVFEESRLQQFAAASSIAPRNAAGDTPALIDLAQMINAYGANNPIIGVISAAFKTPGAVVTTNPATPGFFTITLPGGQGTIVVNGLTSVVITTPTGGKQTVTPPPPNVPAACKGGTGVPLSPTGGCQ
jgi:hypothetical protein